MALDVTKWSAEPAELYRGLAQHRMPLVRGQKRSVGIERLAGRSGQELFPEAASPEALLAGLLLFGGDWEQAHEEAQNLETREGSYLHAIVHRMEPEAWNSAYWFRRVGKHPIFPELAAEAEHILAERSIAQFRVEGAWNPSGFIEFCEQAATEPGSAAEHAAVDIQHAEWQLLMEWCNQARTSGLKLLHK